MAHYCYWPYTGGSQCIGSTIPRTIKHCVCGALFGVWPGDMSCSADTWMLPPWSLCSLSFSRWLTNTCLLFTLSPPPPLLSPLRPEPRSWAWLCSHIVALSCDTVALGREIKAPPHVTTCGITLVRLIELEIWLLAHKRTDSGLFCEIWWGERDAYNLHESYFELWFWYFNKQQAAYLMHASSLNNIDL